MSGEATAENWRTVADLFLDPELEDHRDHAGIYRILRDNIGRHPYDVVCDLKFVLSIFEAAIK